MLSSWSKLKHLKRGSSTPRPGHVPQRARHLAVNRTPLDPWPRLLCQETVAQRTPPRDQPVAVPPCECARAARHSASPCREDALAPLACARAQQRRKLMRGAQLPQPTPCLEAWSCGCPTLPTLSARPRRERADQGWSGRWGFQAQGRGRRVHAPRLSSPRTSSNSQAAQAVDLELELLGGEKGPQVASPQHGVVG